MRRLFNLTSLLARAVNQLGEELRKDWTQCCGLHDRDPQVLARYNMPETQSRFRRMGIQYDLIFYRATMADRLNVIDSSQRTAARVAALAYLIPVAVVALATDAAFQQALGASSLQGLVRLNWSAIWAQYYVGLAFWALSATMFAWLWLKSRYIPAALAMFGVVSAAWCVFCTFAYIINPAFSRVVNLWWFDTPLAVFDITLSFWLLFKGLRDPASVYPNPLLNSSPRRLSG